MNAIKIKIAYLIAISFAVISSFTYLGARIEIDYAQQEIAAKSLESALLKQQMQKLSATTQLSSPLFLHIARLEEHIEKQQIAIDNLSVYANHWVLTAVLLLWATAIALWYQLRKQLDISHTAQAAGGRLWLSRLLFYGGMGLIFSSVFLPNQTADIDLLWILVVGLVLAILGVALRIGRRVPK